jgi:hypothetical protein
LENGQRNKENKNKNLKDVKLSQARVKIFPSQQPTAYNKSVLVIWGGGGCFE